MEVGYGEAEPCRGLESTGWRMHADRRGRERVVRGKDEGAPVLTLVVGGILRPCENVVPSVALLSVFGRHVVG